MICITQYLCKNRHCILAAAWDETDETADNISSRILEQMESGLIEKRCGVCSSDQFHFEHGRTRFESMEQAERLLREVETANRWSRWLLDFQRFVKAKNN